MSALQARVVREYGPHWKVAWASGESPHYIVIDTSGAHPVKVAGPMTRREAESFASVQAQLFAAIHGQVEG